MLAPWTKSETMFAVTAIWCGMAILADSVIKNGSYVLGAVIYAACVLPAIYSFRNEEFGWVTVAWAAMSLLIGLLVSVVVFHEPLTGKRLLAAILAVVATVLLK